MAVSPYGIRRCGLIIALAQCNSQNVSHMSKNLESDPSGKDSPPQVATHATETSTLALNKPVLLGTFGSPEKPGALIRMPSGHVEKVSKGESTRVGKVVGISEGEVIVARHGHTSRLTMPN